MFNQRCKKGGNTEYPHPRYFVVKLLVDRFHFGLLTRQLAHHLPRPSHLRRNPEARQFHAVKMVKFRGIHISVISQIDARPLPEYSTAHAFDASGCAVACYLPIYLGSQIWFEYSVEGPHPQNAMYLFKLFMDGRLVTSWVG